MVDFVIIYLFSRWVRHIGPIRLMGLMGLMGTIVGLEGGGAFVGGA